MSTRNPAKPDRTPMIALVHHADRAFQAHMVESAHQRGRPDLKPWHNAVFAHLGDTPRRAADLATAAGMTRQSMGELVRELVGLGILEMVPDPDDGRAKLVTFSKEGKRFASAGFRHLRAIEDRLTTEFGDDYEAARRVLERIAEVLADIPGTAQG
jgi:DNA-binding MarR family transcriptional regulator